MNTRRNSLSTLTTDPTLEAKVMLAGLSAAVHQHQSQNAPSAAAVAIGKRAEFNLNVTIAVAKRLAKKNGFGFYGDYIKHAEQLKGPKNFRNAVNNFLTMRATKTGQTILQVQTKLAKKESGR
jgi:hypothetical protein